MLVRPQCEERRENSMKFNVLGSLEGIWRHQAGFWEAFAGILEALGGSWVASGRIWGPLGQPPGEITGVVGG